MASTFCTACRAVSRLEKYKHVALENQRLTQGLRKSLCCLFLLASREFTPPDQYWSSFRIMPNYKNLDALPLTWSFYIKYLCIWKMCILQNICPWEKTNLVMSVKRRMINVNYVGLFTMLALLNVKVLKKARRKLA